jgi:hypothetical protein
MHIEALSDAALLDTWERCQHMHPLDQGIALLAAGCPDSSWETLAGLSIGRRDDLLLRLRAATLGPWLHGHGHCPGCTEAVEFQVNTSDLCALQPNQNAVAHWTLDLGAIRLQGRLPDSTDLAAIAGCQDPLQARRLLARRCISQANCGAAPWDAEAISEEIMAALSAQIAKADPLADIELQLHCPSCGHQWPASLDIASFFWIEISAHVDRLLRDIHLLARAYGWRESEILALTPRRRQRYIDMVVQWTC